MNGIFTLNSKTYLSILEFQKHQCAISHDLCVHFCRLEFLLSCILPINILYPLTFCTKKNL